MFRLFLLLFLCACSSFATGRVKVGLSLALSGPASLLGSSYLEGFTAYIETHRDSRIDPFYLDDGYEPTRALENIRIFRKMGIDIVVGETGTPTSLTILPYLSYHNMLLIAPFTGASFLYTVYDNVFLIRASYRDEVKCIIDKLFEAGRYRIAVFYQNDAFGKDVLKSIRSYLKSKGFLPVAEGSFPRNTVNVRNAVITIVREKPDAIIMVAPYEPCRAFMEEVLRSGLGSVTFCSISFTGNSFLLSKLKGKRFSMLYSEVMPDVSSNIPVVKEFRKALLPKSHNGLSRIQLEGYLAAKFLDMVLKGLKKPNAETVKKYIQTRRFFDLGGITLLFSRTRRVGRSTVYLTEVKNGKVGEAETCEAEE